MANHDGVVYGYITIMNKRKAYDTYGKSTGSLTGPDVADWP
jgi:hypothetical protein